MANSLSYIWPTAILDADFAIKQGRIKKYKSIETIFQIMLESC
jgi:hypothetical protein